MYDVVRTLCRALRAIAGLLHTALTLKTALGTLCGRCVDVVATLWPRCADVVYDVVCGVGGYVVQTFRLTRTLCDVVRRCGHVVATLCMTLCGKFFDSKFFLYFIVTVFHDYLAASAAKYCNLEL